MKSVFRLLAITAVMAMMGCQSEIEITKTADAVKTTKTSALAADICGKCGCCAGCDDCCSQDAEKCSCGFNKGSALCCAEGVKPSSATYCKSCGHVKGSDACCAQGNESCSKCGLAKGAPLCCKIKPVSSEHKHGSEHDGGQEHASDEHEHEGDHVEGSGS